MSKVYFDAGEGYMDVRIDTETVSVEERAYNSAYPLHTGKLNNLLYKILLTVSGLMVATLCGLGILSFIRRLGR